MNKIKVGEKVQWINNGWHTGIVTLVDYDRIVVDGKHNLDALDVKPIDVENIKMIVDAINSHEELAADAEGQTITISKVADKPLEKDAIIVYIYKVIGHDLFNMMRATWSDESAAVAKFDLILNSEHNPKKCITLDKFCNAFWKNLEDDGDIPNGLYIDYANFGGVCTETPTGEKSKDFRLTSYQFNVVPRVSYGGSEGIYIDVDLCGQLQYDHKANDQVMHIGTIKTLSSNKEAMKKMGELCGMIVYHATHFIDSHIDEFDGCGK